MCVLYTMERITHKQYEDALDIVDDYDEQTIQDSVKNCKYRLEQRIMINTKEVNKANGK